MCLKYSIIFVRIRLNSFQMSIKEFLNVFLCEQLWEFQERIRNLSPDHRLPDDSDVLFLICSGCVTAQREMPHSGCRHELAVKVMKCWWRPQKSFCWESWQFKVGWWLIGNNTALSQRHLKQGRCAYVDICIHTASPPPTNNHRYHSTWQWRRSPAKIWTFTLSPFFLNLPKNKPLQEKQWKVAVFYSLQQDSSFSPF